MKPSNAWHASPGFKYPHASLILATSGNILYLSYFSSLLLHFFWGRSQLLVVVCALHVGNSKTVDKWMSVYFLKYFIYLFMGNTQREAETQAEAGREKKKEEEAGREPDAGLNPGLQDHTLGRRRR